MKNSAETWSIWKALIEMWQPKKCKNSNRNGEFQICKKKHYMFEIKYLQFTNLVQPPFLKIFNDIKKKRTQLHLVICMFSKIILFSWFFNMFEVIINICKHFFKKNKQITKNQKNNNKKLVCFINNFKRNKLKCNIQTVSILKTYLFT